jgi:uncharacterized protein (AIM24 family)/tetratricopeptide (TPR) repeat protein
MEKGPAPFDQGLFLMHLHKGKEYFEQNQFQKAREELEAAYHLRPQDEKILNMLGMTYFKLEMLPQAEEMYTALAANNPDVYTLQSNLGLIRLKLEKIDLAEDALIHALELQPSNPKAHFYLGLLYEKMEKFEKALFHFEQAKADKMIHKMQEKLGALKTREYTLMPFEVLEVISDEIVSEDATMLRTEAGPAVMTALAEPPHVEEPVTPASAESEWVEGGASTGKMRRRDVIEAMEQLEEADEEEEELLEDASEEEIVNQEEGRVEEVQEEPVWEKTHPKIVPPLEENLEEVPVEEPFPTEEPYEEEEEIYSEQGAIEEEPVKAAESEAVDSDLTPVPMQGNSFFIAEETAADISTFLAQSQTEEPAAEEDFIEEPPNAPIGPSLHIAVASAIEVPQPEQKIEEETRIPTPEEVENASPFAGAQPVEIETPPSIEPSVIEASVEQSFAAAMRRPSETEHTMVMDAQQPPFPQMQTQELYQPANLDQFSRERFYVQPLIGADRFLLIDPHLLEIIISERLVVRKGTISSFTGNLTFDAWRPQYEESIPLTQVNGSGILFLADRRMEIYIISLNNESLYVESNHLLVAQAALKVEPLFFRQTGTENGFSMVKVSGRGTVALTCQTKPLTLNVYETMPANIPADALIAWSGRLECDMLSDEELQSIMMPGGDSLLLRFTGSGDVIVEQGSLWGERRSRK